MTGGVAVAVGIMFLTSVFDRANDDADLRADAIEVYENSVIGPMQRGGRVVEQGMKPAVQQLADGGPSQATMQAVAWVDELRAVRSTVKAVEAPGALRDVARLFDESLALYADAATTIGAAAIATGEPRQKLLADAVGLARRADDRYDEASELLQRLRRQAGLPVSTRFPNPEATNE